MEEFDLIPKRVPVRFDSVDTDNWADEALCLLQNRDWKTRPYYLVGTDAKAFHLSALAFYWVMGLQGLEFHKHQRFDAFQRVSAEGLKRAGVEVIHGSHPESFFDLMAGAFAIPMGEGIDSVSDSYDAGFPIWVLPLRFKD